VVAARGSSARIVAATRIVLCAIFLSSPEPTEALHIAAKGAHAWVAPEGLSWFAAQVPMSAAVTAIAYRMYITCAFLGLAGLYTRFALPGLLGSAFYLFAIRQLTGVVLHDMHLLWMLALLLFATSERTWSVDAWFRKGASFGPAQATERKQSTFLFWARTLLGLVYFFPGLWKLRAQGLSWALSDNLQNQLWAKWFQHGTVPTVRLDLHPGVLHVLGIATIAFELGFIMLVHIGPRVRIGLAVAGIAFHLSIERFMFIPFSSLWLCYIVLLSGARRPAGGRGHLAWRSMISGMGAGIALLLAVQGFRGKTQAFPFACYPTFQYRVGDTLPDMIVTTTDASGQARVVPMARNASGHRSQLAWGEVWSVLGLYGAALSESRLRAYVDEELARASITATRVRVEIGYFQTDPAHWGEAPKTRTRVAVWERYP